MYENSSEENDGTNLCGDHLSVSDQIKDRQNFDYKKPKMFLNQSLYHYYRILYGMVNP